jgi:hypothetical protein
VFACGEGEEVILCEQLGETAVVCDHGRGNAKSTSDLDNVDFLIKEACIVGVERISHPLQKCRNIRTDTQNEERRGEEEEQG